MQSTKARANELPLGSTEPWQLEMFRRSLKKQQKLRALLGVLGDVSGQQCLLVTCGDNTGALNWYFRERGGIWHWGDVAGDNVGEIAELLGEPVHHLPKEGFPFTDGQFDCLVAIDVLEHLEAEEGFLREVRRVLRPGGRAVVTVPNGDPRLVVNQIRWRVGMTPEKYGHWRAGYTLDQLRDCVKRAGFEPVGQGAYSRFFTETVELFINFGYIFVLSRKKGGAKPGQIAPTSAGDLESHGLIYRLYSRIFPLAKWIAKLDRLIPGSSGYAVIVDAVRPSSGERAIR